MLEENGTALFLLTREEEKLYKENTSVLMSARR